jgi:hypothetical protein
LGIFESSDALVGLKMIWKGRIFHDSKGNPDALKAIYFAETRLLILVFAHSFAQSPSMPRLLPFLLLLLTILTTPKSRGLERYLYMSTPDASQPGGSGNGILVFDLDQNHKFVKRISIPFKEGLRGFCGNLKRHSVYYSSTARRLGAFDLETEKVLWERQYQMGCDRASIPPDGSKLYVPTGWWYRGEDGGLMTVNPENGDLLNIIKLGKFGLGSHNSIATLDGKYVFLGTETNLWAFNTSNTSEAFHFQDVGEYGVFPFTVDSANHFAYVCLGKHVGFDVIDLRSRSVSERVYAHDPSDPGKAISHRTHGAALTPDERELWISDQDGKKLFIFDASYQPPRETSHIDLSQEGHGWITFSLDGRFAWCHTPDVIDVASRKIIATLRDENGKPVCGSKFLEVHFDNGKVVAMGDQFGLGRKKSRTDTDAINQ